MEKKTNSNQDGSRYKKEDKDLPGYPHYPENEDITNPENNTGMQALDDEGNPIDEANIDEDKLDKGLDIPGSELDDDDEEIGEEDEENNYYSLGGDNHEALEEDNGD